jgi:hypothetical protein
MFTVLLLTYWFPYVMHLAIHRYDISIRNLGTNIAATAAPAPKLTVVTPEAPVAPLVDATETASAPAVVPMQE